MCQSIVPPSIGGGNSFFLFKCPGWAEVTGAALHLITAFHRSRHTRNCQREYDAWLNTDFLHHSPTESDHGIYRWRPAPLSVWLCSPCSSLQHLDVSHLQRSAQSPTRHQTGVRYAAWETQLLWICLSCKHRLRGPRLIWPAAYWLLLGCSIYQSPRRRRPEGADALHRSVS